MGRSWSATLSVTGLFIVAIGLGIASAQAAARPTDEHAFVSQVAMSNMAAIQLGHMATKKAQNADVQKFAQATIQDHLKAQQQLADAAYGAGIKWPTKLDDKHQQIQQRLSKLSNEQFDREYMKTMIERHRDVEKILAARVSNGGGSESPLAVKVQQWAASTLPDVRADLKEAEQVYGVLGAE